ncbi:MAG: aldehyde ferredoxin oxidoreductase family protein, partial [Methanosarcinaceae archaeon]|nr:aldehyde ferredoxin oxidoreductase family protein [Methanosarcinaceae archaeon]
MPCLRGKTIIINLGSGRINEALTDEKLLSDYLGGRGLGVKLLSGLTEHDADPLAPENPLIFTTGPLTGLAPMAGRFVLTSKSPLTGTVFSYNSGGTFGKELKWAGIDALIISGKAKEPVYVEVKAEGNEIKTEIRSAASLWGKNTEECTEALESLGSVACIGRAGENLVRISSLVNDSVHSGRGGLGAVAGSKNLKAVVVKGKKKPEITDPGAFKEMEIKVLKLLEANPVLSKGLARYGTPVLVRLLNYMKVLPVRNFRARESEFAEKLSGEWIKANYSPEGEACFNCPIACKQKIKDRGQSVPDYDALWAFGLNPENPDFESVLSLSKLCTDYGLDPVSAGAVLGAHFEYEGKKPETPELMALLKQIGEGNSKAGEGSRRYLGLLGAKSLSPDVKGLELAGFDVRGIRGQALAYATSPHGADFLTAFMVGPELLGKPLGLDRFALKGKAGILQVFENLTAVLDSLVLCPFTFFALSEETCSGLLQTGTGRKVSGAELLKIGERIWNLERIINLGAGFSRADDTLPARLFE